MMAPLASMAGSIDFVAAEGASPTEIRAVAAASTIVRKVAGSACFADYLAGRKLIQTNGRTPKDVVVHVTQLSATVKVAFYFRCMKSTPECTDPTIAMAYRQPPDRTVHLNRAYYNVDRPGFDIYEMAGTLAHEALGHGLGGYEHDFDWAPDRDFSVPYSISGASTANGDAFQHCRKPLGF